MTGSRKKNPESWPPLSSTRLTLGATPETPMPLAAAADGAADVRAVAAVVGADRVDGSSRPHSVPVDIG
jgi:hypothetical protein